MGTFLVSGFARRGMHVALAALLSSLAGCEALDFYEGFMPVSDCGDADRERRPELQGVWSGTLYLSDETSGEYQTVEFSVEFDQFGEPVGREYRWSDDWPQCLKAGEATTVLYNPQAARLGGEGSPEAAWQFITVNCAEFRADGFLLEYGVYEDRYQIVNGLVREFDTQHDIEYKRAWKGELIDTNLMSWRSGEGACSADCAPTPQRLFEGFLTRN